LDFVGSRSYKKSFVIPWEEGWQKQGAIDGLVVYRKGRFSLRFKDTGFFSDFEERKYLIISRNVRLKNRVAVEAIWSDEEPKKPPILHAR
jgi:hypothetical protein